MDTQKPSPDRPDSAKKEIRPDSVREIGGYADQKLLEPTRYGDWDVKGRCTDF